ncbi:MAG: LicD family protein [Bacteroidales bacterium]|nr:LicD family protein [Bacteroidales bacterium]
MNDFVPTEELNRVHEILLDLFKKFKMVCEKYDLKYLANGGTLIGAARHHGFIPWDDDMDISMMYDDYVKLLEIPQSEFEFPYYLQSYKSDENAEISAARIRNSNTTGCTKWEFDNLKIASHNKGIFVDISPLFYVSDNEKIRNTQKHKLDELWSAIRGWNATTSIEHGNTTSYSKYIPDWLSASNNYTIGDLKQKYMDECNQSKGELIGMTSFRTHNNKLMWPKEWFDDVVEIPFEDTTILCPKMYDEILSRTYGDWRTPVYNSSIHEMYVLDVNTPYNKNNELNFNH